MDLYGLFYIASTDQRPMMAFFASKSVGHQLPDMAKAKAGKVDASQAMASRPMGGIHSPIC